MLLSLLGSFTMSTLIIIKTSCWASAPMRRGCKTAAKLEVCLPAAPAPMRRDCKTSAKLVVSLPAASAPRPIWNGPNFRKVRQQSKARAGPFVPKYGSCRSSLGRSKVPIENPPGPKPPMPGLTKIPAPRCGRRGRRGRRSTGCRQKNSWRRSVLWRFRKTRSRSTRLKDSRV